MTLPLPSARDPADIGLGLDAGGTYTDAVLYRFQDQRVLAKAKALTTYHRLADGIGQALAQLPPALLREARITALSTTLATNAMVEGRGHKVGLILLSPWDWTEEDLDYHPRLRVPGAVSITGDILTPLDEDACRRAIVRLVEEERCAALAVAGYATVRNPTQAQRVRALVAERHDLPVVCGHEISRHLNMIHSAQTAIANARLLPIVRELLAAVRQALGARGVTGPLMVVKGDGSCVDESVARARPVETVLSGPAASACGARLLTRATDAIVVDIGGTTTDCAVFENGRIATAPDGARVGAWTMGVDAIAITTVGLGGDSRLAFDRNRRLLVGPTRNIPIACLAAQHPAVHAFLDGFNLKRWRGSESADALDILILGTPPEIALTDRETELLALLASGPLPAVQACERMDVPAPRFLPLERLEAAGIVKRAALTPTDLLHVSGRFVRWDADAARKALDWFAALYGRPADDVLTLALETVTRRLFEAILWREISLEQPKLERLPEAWDFLLNKAFSTQAGALEMRLALRRPIIAIGAPADALVRPVGNHLDADILVPEHADVANAIGAIGSEIVVRETVLIKPGIHLPFSLHGAEECLEFIELEAATEKAAALAEARARQRALAAGAHAPHVSISRHDSQAGAADGAMIFIERTVTALARGGLLKCP